MSQHAPHAHALQAPQAHPVVPLKKYYAIFIALMVMLLLTVWVAFLHLGAFNTVVAMSIATIKALLVALYFMHLRYSSKVSWIFAAAGIIWLGILIALTLNDTETRTWLDTGGTPYYEPAP